MCSYTLEEMQVYTCSTQPKLYNAIKFKNINIDNYYFHKSTLMDDYLIIQDVKMKWQQVSSPQSTLLQLLDAIIQTLPPAFGTTLQNCTMREVHITSQKLNVCYASHVPMDKQDAEDKSWVWKPQVTLHFPKLRIQGIHVFLMEL